MQEFWESVLTRLQDLFDPASLGLHVADFLLNLVASLVVFAAYYLLWRLLKVALRGVSRSAKLDKTSTIFAQTILKYGVLAIGVVNAMAAAGINTASVLASLGIAGLTVGFAARDAFSNLISGLLIYLDRPFVIGDLVEIEDNYGQVDQITLRSTRIITTDGKMLAVPNADIINKTVASYTNFPHLRLDVPVTVGVNESLDRVRAVLLQLVKNDPDYQKDPAPRVIVTQLNDYNVTMELQAWIVDERAHVVLRAALRERMFNALNEAGVEMPFETLAIRPLEVLLPNGKAD
jgi:small conductance mechanosensitive channel